MVVGLLRLALKPIVSAVREVVAATATKKDDEFVEKVEESRAWGVFVYLLDWLTSIKLRK